MFSKLSKWLGLDNRFKKILFIILLSGIAWVWGSDIKYWMDNSQSVFTFRFLQSLVDNFGGVLLVTFVSSSFAATGYIKVKNKLLGIEPEPKQDKKTKAISKVADEASARLDRIPVLKAAHPKMDDSSFIANRLEAGIADQDSFDSLAELAE